MGATTAGGAVNVGMPSYDIPKNARYYNRAPQEVAMHVETGKVVPFETIPHGEEKNYVEVKRDLTVHEKNDMQIKLYSPCGCGSGKKFKFCCHRKLRG